MGFILRLASAKELRLHLRAVGQGAKGNSHVHGADVEVKAEQGREKEEEEREKQKGGEKPNLEKLVEAGKYSVSSRRTGNTSDFLAITPPCLLQ